MKKERKRRIRCAIYHDACQLREELLSRRRHPGQGRLSIERDTDERRRPLLFETKNPPGPPRETEWSCAPARARKNSARTQKGGFARRHGSGPGAAGSSTGAGGLASDAAASRSRSHHSSPIDSVLTSMSLGPRAHTKRNVTESCERCPPKKARKNRRALVALCGF